jgi:1,4-alpha-glucan branching enzyme
VLDTDAVQYGGSGYNGQDRVVTQSAPCQGYPCHLQVNLPPLGALFFELER